MSFILDALKKSEAERQRQAGPALLEMRIVRPARRLPVWAVIVGVALVICVLVLAWVALQRTAAPASVAGAAPATAAVPQAAAPAAGAAGTSGMIGQQPAGPAATVAPATAAPTRGVTPMTSVGAESQNSAAAADDNPADVAPAEPAPASASPSHSGTAGLRNYAELGGKLPELRLDLHVYAAKPADRYAFINMHKVREGEVTSEGVAVKEITPDGVVLEYQGTEFLLGRQ
jgi:general secretion pathway protein B